MKLNSVNKKLRKPKIFSDESVGSGIKFQVGFRVVRKIEFPEVRGGLHASIRRQLREA